MINLDSVAIDRISGFIGMVTARTEYLSGRVQICLTPQDLTKDGNLFKPEWFDEQQLDETTGAKGIGFHLAGGDGPGKSSTSGK